MVHFLQFVRIYSIALSMNSINRFAYCSGSQVEMPSTLLPYLTVFAAFAACQVKIATSCYRLKQCEMCSTNLVTCFLTPYCVSTSMIAMK